MSTQPHYIGNAVELYHGDCLAVLPTLSDNSTDLILTDPPYYRVKTDAWDRQWPTPAAYLRWLDDVLAQFARVLRPNGSLYVFASPEMAARVEVGVGARFEVVNRVTWRKEAGFHKTTCKEDLRSFFPASEAIIFAEHVGADNMAKGEAGYEAKCDELRGFVFEPLRKYLDDERQRAGFDRAMCDKACGNQMSGHYFSRVQWTLPTQANYEKLRAALNTHPPHNYLHRSYDDLRRQYDDLRRQYDDLRRPFQVTADIPYTDVWDFPTVGYYKGKHPCEKPQALLRHIIAASSRPGAVVLDAFFGSGATGEAAMALGRRCIGIEMSREWCWRAAKRLRLRRNITATTVATTTPQGSTDDAPTTD